ncbi:LacI family DNA-binding transcriptional regulator [Ideonella sp. DXS29W]|uniref:LacI family DNA-binding transcriptional regulator n=1 Tax=Ideonella lacteola TaxID=2984193 RepID=A0ABU9BVR4_9BURK
MQAAHSAITILEVARRAGVSPSTVSRVVNGSAGVSERKRLAVEATIRELNFRPNPSARSLKTGTTMSIGVVVQDLESPFFTRMLRGIEEGLADSGHVPLIVSGLWNAEEEEVRIRLLAERRIDGLIVLAGHLSDEQLRDFARIQPVAVAGRQLSGPNLSGQWVNQDEAGYLATTHLMSLGHRRVAFIAGPDSHADAQHRHDGYLRAHRDHGIEPNPALLAQGDFTETSGMLAMNRLLDSQAPFTAVFAANDQMAYGARVALYRRGIRVPDDISLVGVDDMPASAFMTPALTTVHQPLYDIGRHVAAELLRLMGRPAPHVDVPEVRLILRETTRRL